MSERGRISVCLCVFVLATLLAPAQSAGQNASEFSVLVFSKTNGYRHAAIPNGIQALRDLGRDHGFRIQATEDSTVFRSSRLNAFDVVVFLNTTGDVLGPHGQRALREFVRAGGGFVGVHSATDTEYDWSWYGRLVGAYFAGHPKVQTATVRVVDGSHPSTNMLPAEWVRRDEWYNFGSNPRDSVRVLLTLDESTYDGGMLGEDHPIAWCHRFDGGRAWYTAGGHTEESYRDPLFRKHLLGGLRWAAGTTSGR